MNKIIENKNNENKKNDNNNKNINSITGKELVEIIQNGNLEDYKFIFTGECWNGDVLSPSFIKSFNIGSNGISNENLEYSVDKENKIVNFFINQLI